MSLSIFKIPSSQREEVRRGIQAVHAEGEGLSIRRIQKHCGGATDTIALLLRAVRAGHLQVDTPWDGSPPSLDLEQAIRSIACHADRTRIHEEIAARLASGTLSPTVAKALQDSLSAARLSAKAASDDDFGRGDTDPVHLVDHSTFLMARVVNRIVSPQILDEVMAFVLEAAERDLREFPNATLAEVQRLQAAEGDSSQ